MASVLHQLPVKWERQIFKCKIILQDELGNKNRHYITVTMGTGSGGRLLGWTLVLPITSSVILAS